MNGTQDGVPSTFGLKEEKSASFVLICGIVTTALTLLGVYLLDVNAEDFHIMGWYANYVLPVGAIIVGLAAASGYGVASWFSGVKITRRLLWTIVTLQFLAYFAAQYIEFYSLHLIHHANGQPVGFFEYYNFEARSFAWKQSDGSAGKPLGAWGYFFRVLEVAGFVLGGLIVPLILRKAPYCPVCQLYMKSKQLAVIPASVPVKRVKKSDMAAKAAYETEQNQALDAGKQMITNLQQSSVGNNPVEFRKRLEELQLGKKQALKLPARFSVQLIYCKRCRAGHLVAKLLLGQGNQVKQSEFARTELHPEFVRSVT